LKRIAVSTTAGTFGTGTGCAAVPQLGLLDRPLRACAAAGEARLPGSVEGGPQRVVQRAQANLVAGRDLLAARTSRAPARRSSVSTIGRTIRSIAA
jgi:hypothetical protein